MAQLNDTHFLVFLALAWGWTALVIAASIIFRLNRGKPIRPKAPASAVFSERRASGGAVIGGANNCLLVFVTTTEVGVTPTFPFTLMFIPEVYGLEATLSARQISEAVVSRRWWGKRVTIIRSDGRRPLRLKLRKLDAFIDALRQIGVTVVDKQT